MTIGTHIRWRTALAALLAVAAVGCSNQDKSKTKLRRLEGVANKIDLQTNEVSMTVTREDGSTQELTGVVDGDTDIQINGRAQKLSDVHEGDRVVAYVRKGNAEGKYVVTRVEVERPQSADWKASEAGAGARPGASGQPPAVSTVTPKPPTNGGTKPVADADAEGGTEDPFFTPEGQDEEDLRIATEDAIYGQIRVRMEEAIEKRKDLLKAGTEPSDPSVRVLEGLIMRARDLLIKHDELVEDVDPPIVLRAPQPPPGQ